MTQITTNITPNTYPAKERFFAGQVWVLQNEAYIISQVGYQEYALIKIGEQSNRFTQPIKCKFIDDSVSLDIDPTQAKNMFSASIDEFVLAKSLTININL